MHSCSATPTICAGTTLCEFYAKSTVLQQGVAVLLVSVAKPCRPGTAMDVHVGVMSMSGKRRSCTQL
jgi:hypothetical protein